MFSCSCVNSFKLFSTYSVVSINLLSTSTVWTVNSPLVSNVTKGTVNMFVISNVSSSTLSNRYNCIV